MLTKLWSSATPTPPSNNVCSVDPKPVSAARLIDLVASGKNQQKYQAARKLAELALTHEHRVGIAKLGGIQALLLILKSTSEQDGLKALAVSALWNLAFLDANNTVIATAIPMVVGLLRPNSKSLTALVAGLLSELALSSDTYPAVERGGIALLVDEMKTGGIETKENATRALWRLAANEANRRAIRKAGCLATVFAQLEGTSDDQKTSCIGLLRELARSKNIDMTKYKHHKGLVELIRSGTRVQKELAVIALRDLTQKLVQPGRGHQCKSGRNASCETSALVSGVLQLR